MLSPELLKKIENIVIKSRYLANEMFSGEYKTAFRGRGMEFEEVREYIPGDDVRLIDWNVSARMDKPFIKVHREEREQAVMLVVDSSQSLYFGSKKRLKREAVAELAAVLARAATNSNDKVGLILFSDRVEYYLPPRKGKSHVWQVVKSILTHKPIGQKTNLEGALHFLSRVVHRRCVCFVISDFLTEGFESVLKAVSRRYDVVNFIMRDPLELNWPGKSFVNLKSAEEEGVSLGQNMGGKNIRKFNEYQKLSIQNLTAQFQGMNMDALFLKTNEDYIDTLIRFFRFRDKRRN